MFVIEVNRRRWTIHITGTTQTKCSK